MSDLIVNLQYVALPLHYFILLPLQQEMPESVKRNIQKQKERAEYAREPNRLQTGVLYPGQRKLRHA